MGKMTLAFDMDVDHEEIDNALNGWRWRATLYDLDQELRTTTKHGLIDNREATSIEVEIYNRIRDMIRDKMAYNGLAGKDLI